MYNRLACLVNGNFQAGPGYPKYYTPGWGTWGTVHQAGVPGVPYTGLGYPGYCTLGRGTWGTVHQAGVPGVLYTGPGLSPLVTFSPRGEPNRTRATLPYGKNLGQQKSKNLWQTPYDRFHLYLAPKLIKNGHHVNFHVNGVSVIWRVSVK